MNDLTTRLKIMLPDIAIRAHTIQRLHPTPPCDAQIAAGPGERAVDAGGRAVESWKRRQRSRGEDRSPARFSCAAALHPHEIARSAPVQVGSSRVKSGSQPDLTTSWKSGRLFALQSACTSSRQIGWSRGSGMSTSRARLEQDDHCSGRLQPTDLPTWPDLIPYPLVVIQVAVEGQVGSSTRLDPI